MVNSSPSAIEDFRRFFLRGLAALLPTLLTIALILWAYNLVDQRVGKYITEGLLRVCSSVFPRPAEGWVDPDSDSITYGTPIDQWNEEGRRLTIEYVVIHHPALNSPDANVRQGAETRRNRALWRIAAERYRLHLLGFLIAIILVYFIGFFLASFVGRTTWRMAEGILSRIPLIRAVYPNIKQVTDFLLSEGRVEFGGVVAIEYPRKGVWSIGLTTGAPIAGIQRQVPEDLVTIFIPSSPTPITGYVITVPRKEVVELNMTIDEGLRFAISAGVIKPGSPLPGTEPSSS